MAKCHAYIYVYIDTEMHWIKSILLVEKSILAKYHTHLIQYVKVLHCQNYYKFVFVHGETIKYGKWVKETLLKA